MAFTKQTSYTGLNFNIPIHATAPNYSETLRARYPRGFKGRSVSRATDYEVVPYGYSKSGVKGFRMRYTVELIVEGGRDFILVTTTLTINNVRLKWKGKGWYTYPDGRYDQQELFLMFDFARKGRGLTRFANTLRGFGR